MSDAYVAKIVTLDVLRHFVQVNGGGQRAVAWVAGQQLALITALQLYAVGIGRGAIESRLAGGSLHRRHRGVYLVGHPIPLPGALELAAVLACGAGTFVSDRSATACWVTAPARTLIDFAAAARPDELERAAAEARVLGLLRDGELETALKRAGRRPGVGRMRAFLEAEAGPALTRSKAERLLRRLIRDAGLPLPQFNVDVHGWEVDALWPDMRLVVEVDGYGAHGHRTAFERDRRKQMALVAAGYTVVRVSWRQLTGEPLLVAAMLASALTSGRARS